MTQSHDDNALFDRTIEAGRAQTEGGLAPARRDAVFAGVMNDVSSPRRSFAPWIAGGALAAAAAAAVLFFVAKPADRTPPALATVVYRAGDVRTAGEVVTEASALRPGSKVIVDDGARIDLEIDGVARIAAVGPSTIERTSDGVAMRDGAAAFAVRPHPADRPFVVAVGTERVVVRGTRFDVHATSGRVAAVHVEEGLVDVEAAGKIVAVPAGKEHGDGKTEAIVATLEDVWWDTAPSDAYLYVDTKPSGARIRIDGTDLGRAPILVRWAAGDFEVEASLDGHESASERVTIAAERPARVEIALSKIVTDTDVTVIDEPKPTKRRVRRRRNATPDPWDEARRLLQERRCDRLDVVVEALVARSKTKAESNRAKLLSAECRLRRGERKRALSLYRAIDAEAARFEVAKILADDGAAKSALEAFDAYLARHPKGRFEDVASMRRCEVLVTLGRLAKAESCLVEYRRRPAGVRRRQADLLYAELLRRGGRCAEAIGVFEKVLANRPSRSEAERARYRIAQCHVRAKAPAAKAAVDAYLEHHPNGRHAAEVRKWRD